MDVSHWRGEITHAEFNQTVSIITHDAFHAKQTKDELEPHGIPKICDYLKNYVICMLYIMFKFVKPNEMTLNAIIHGAVECFILILHSDELSITWPHYHLKVVILFNI